MVQRQQPEVWMRGAIPGYPGLLQPVVHSLLQSLEEVQRHIAPATPEQLWERPNGAASAGYHVRHAAGSLDRLLTYARGEQLSAEQLAALKRESEPDMEPGAATRLADEFARAIERSLAQVSDTSEWTLGEPRGVGRAQLPSTVLGLLYHAAEHTQRHMGQMVTTLKIVS
jgi:uncharacterized damage-inducible protein DinB